MHQDPKASGAWNCCLVGRKRWCLFPPSVAPSELSPEGANDEDEQYLKKSPAYWWLDTYPKLAARGRELGMVEVGHMGEVGRGSMEVQVLNGGGEGYCGRGQDAVSGRSCGLEGL